MSNNTEIVTSIQRLQRAGKTYHSANSNLYQAVYNVAQEIIQAAPEEIELPRGYIVRHLRSSVGGEYFLLNTLAEEGTWRFQDNPGVIVDAKKSYYLHGDFNQWIDKAPKSVVLQFAKDVREGLLDEIAQFLEDQSSKSNEIADRLVEK